MQLCDSQIALIRRFRELMPLKDKLESERKLILEQQFKRLLLVRSNRDIYREVVYLYLLNSKILNYVRVIHVYELVDVYLGNSSKWNSLFDITDPIVVILLGYNEMENKRTNEILNQYIAYRKDDPDLKCLIVFYKGLDSLFDSKYGKQSQQPLISLPRLDLYTSSRLGKSSNKFEF